MGWSVGKWSNWSLMSLGKIAFFVHKTIPEGRPLVLWQSSKNWKWLAVEGQKGGPQRKWQLQSVRWKQWNEGGYQPKTHCGAKACQVCVCVCERERERVGGRERRGSANRFKEGSKLKEKRTRRHKLVDSSLRWKYRKVKEAVEPEIATATPVQRTVAMRRSTGRRSTPSETTPKKSLPY